MRCRSDLFTVYFVACLWNLRCSLSQHRQHHVSLLSKTFNSIFLGLNSLDKNSKDLNLDSLLGIKIVRDQITTVTNKLKNSQPERCQINAENFKLIIKTCDKILREATSHVIKVDPAYYEKLGATIGANFTFDVPRRSIDVTLLEPPVASVYHFDENDSDECLSSLMNVPGCRILDECWSNATVPGKTFYPLTHQLLYLQVGVIFGCFPHDLMTTREAKLCSNIFSEYQQIRNLDFPESYRDLFMEQAALCGMAGFDEFFDKKSLRTILSWQDVTDGCWKSIDQKKMKNAKVKRREKQLENHCLCHRTVVALAALVQFVKRGLDACY